MNKFLYCYYRIFVCYSLCVIKILLAFVVILLADYKLAVETLILSFTVSMCIL